MTGEMFSLAAGIAAPVIGATIGAGISAVASSATAVVPALVSGVTLVGENMGIVEDGFNFIGGLANGAVQTTARFADGVTGDLLDLDGSKANTAVLQKQIQTYKSQSSTTASSASKVPGSVTIDGKQYFLLSAAKKAKYDALLRGARNIRDRIQDARLTAVERRRN
jgi:hypothetical protein